MRQLCSQLSFDYTIVLLLWFYQYNGKCSDDGYAISEQYGSPPPPLPPDTPNSPPVFFEYNESRTPMYQETQISTHWRFSAGDSFDEENSFEASIV